jgi:hypothetical protein
MVRIVDEDGILIPDAVRPSMGDKITDMQRQVAEFQAELEPPKKPGHHLFERLLGRFNDEYTEARSDELGELHNAMAEVIAEQGASPNNVLFVLKILEWETMRAAMVQLFPQHDMTQHISRQPPQTTGGGAV